MHFDWLSSSPCLSHSPFFGNQLSFATKLADSLQNGWLGKTARFHHALDTTPPVPQRFPSDQPPPLCFVESPQNFSEQGDVPLGTGCIHAFSIS
jgi:hypothetical protein